MSVIGVHSLLSWEWLLTRAGLRRVAEQDMQPVRAGIQRLAHQSRLRTQGPEALVQQQRRPGAPPWPAGAGAATAGKRNALR